MEGSIKETNRYPLPGRNKITVILEALVGALLKVKSSGAQWRTEGGGVWVFNPLPPEIPKALQNGAKINPIVKTVKNL